MKPLDAQVRLKLKNQKIINADQVGLATSDAKQNRPQSVQLTATASGICITRTISLQNVQEIWIDQQRLSKDELFEHLDQKQRVPAVIKPADYHANNNQPKPVSIRPDHNQLKLPPLPDEPISELQVRETVFYENRIDRPVAPAPLQIERVIVSAYPTNLRGRADWDALIVHMSALNRWGKSIPYRGTARINLWGSRQHFIRGFGPSMIGVNSNVEKLASWTRSIESHWIPPVAEPADNARPAAFELLLTRPFAEQNLQISPAGIVQLELVVPGQGVYYASSDIIPLAQRNSLRDQLLIETGSRFFNREATTGRISRHAAPLRYFTSLRPASRIFTVEP